jgi:hypothetical protein
MLYTYTLAIHCGEKNVFFQFWDVIHEITATLGVSDNAVLLFNATSRHHIMGTVSSLSSSVYDDDSAVTKVFERETNIYPQVCGGV